MKQKVCAIKGQFVEVILACSIFSDSIILSFLTNHLTGSVKIGINFSPKCSELPCIDGEFVVMPLLRSLFEIFYHVSDLFSSFCSSYLFHLEACTFY